MARRNYSDADKAAALAALDANGGNVSLTSKQLNIPRSTLRRWAADEAVSDDVSELRQHKKGELSAELRQIAHALVAAVPTKIEDAPLREVATALGIVIDKMELLSGAATERHEIIDHSGITDDERAARIAALLDRARARRTGQPATDDDADV